MYKKGDRFTYSYPTSIIFGAGVIGELPSYLKNLGFSNPLVVSDPTVVGLGFFKKTLENLKAKGLKPEVFSSIHKNPVKSDVLDGRDYFSSVKADSIVGIGGGAALDVARAIALAVNNRRELFDYDDLEGGDKYVTEPIPHFVTVPTTSGTGSEVGRSAIISEDGSKRKRILFHPTLLARMVFADPELTYDLPPAITAATGMDALTHNMEAFIAKGFHPMSEGIALEGIRLITSNIEKAVHSPDEVSRANMLIGSMMGAVAFQKGLGIVHSLSHPLSTLLDIHHGLGNAVNLPYGMEYNAPVRKEHFTRMAESMGIKNGSADEVVKQLYELNTKLNIPLKLSEIGVKEEHLAALTKLALADFCLPANPREALEADIMGLYRKAL